MRNEAHDFAAQPTLLMEQELTGLILRSTKQGCSMLVICAGFFVILRVAVDCDRQHTITLRTEELYNRNRCDVAPPLAKNSFQAAAFFTDSFTTSTEQGEP